jgi:hypothetical protein
MRKIFFGIIVSTFFLIACNNEGTKTQDAAAPASTETKQAPAEFADAKYVAVGKDFLTNMSSGNMDAWGNSLADNVVWQWNNGDSVAGKTAVLTYWKDRRANAIDSISANRTIRCLVIRMVSNKSEIQNWQINEPMVAYRLPL